MSCGPAMCRDPPSVPWRTGARRRRARRRCCRRRRSWRWSSPTGRPQKTIGSPRPWIRAGSVSASCSESMRTPSTCWRREVGVEPVHLLTGLHERQHELARGLADDGGDAADDPGEERLAEDALLGLGDDQGDRVGAPGHQRAGGLVGHVAELVDRPHRPDPGPLGHLRRAVDDARRRPAPDPGAGGHLLQGGLRAAGLPCHWGAGGHGLSIARAARRGTRRTSVRWP